MHLLFSPSDHRPIDFLVLIEICFHFFFLMVALDSFLLTGFRLNIYLHICISRFSRVGSQRNCVFRYVHLSIMVSMFETGIGVLKTFTTFKNIINRSVKII